MCIILEVSINIFLNNLWDVSRNLTILVFRQKSLLLVFLIFSKLHDSKDGKAKEHALEFLKLSACQMHCPRGTASQF
jgi:hypothetical protein